MRVTAAAVDYPLAEHWNGSTWSSQPTSSAPNAWLRAVSCQSATRCEAVGSIALANFTQTTLALGLTGSQWTRQAMPALPRPTDGYGLMSVSCYSSGCTAVGSSQSGRLLAEAWNGAKWSLQVPVGSGAPAGSTDAEWQAVQCRSASNCTAAGAWDNGTRPFLTLVGSWNGRSWTPSNTPSPSTFGNELYGLSCSLSSPVCTAVGGSQTNGRDTQDTSLAIRS